MRSGSKLLAAVGAPSIRNSARGHSSGGLTDEISIAFNTSGASATRGATIPEMAAPVRPGVSVEVMNFEWACLSGARRG